MQHEDVFGHYLNSEVSRNDDRIGTFHDSENFKQIKLFYSPENSIEVILYYDDFNVVNPLGNKVSKYKVSAFFFVTGNVPNQFRSRLKYINLLLLLPALYVTKYGYKEILQPSLDDLKKLEVTCISVKFENSNRLFKGSISMITADNVAAHALRGFFCSFSEVNRFCRFCNCSAEMQLRILEALRGFFCSFSEVNRFCRFCNCSKQQRERNAPPAEMQLRILEAYNNIV